MFFSVLPLVISFMGTNSPWVTSTAPVSTPINATMLQQNAGVKVTGQTVQANASLGSTGGSTSAFGSLLSGTVLVFGYFYAAVQYIAALAAGALLPYQYVYNWLAWSNATDVKNTASAIAAMVNVLVWFAYANDIIYLISGRFLA